MERTAHSRPRSRTKAPSQPLPADPVLHEGRAAETAVGQRPPRRVPGSVRAAAGSTAPSLRGQVGRALRKVAAPVERAVVGRGVVALVERPHAKFGRAPLEQVEHPAQLLLVLPPLGPGDLQFGILQRQTRTAHAPQQGRIAGYGTLGSVEEDVVALAARRIEHAVLVRHRRIVDPQPLSAGEQRPLERPLIVVDEGPAAP